MVWAWPPPTHHDDAGPFADVASLLPNLYPGNETLLYVISPVPLPWLLVQEGVHTTIHVTLQGDTSGH